MTQTEKNELLQSVKNAVEIQANLQHQPAQLAEVLLLLANQIVAVVVTESYAYRPDACKLLEHALQAVEDEFGLNVYSAELRSIHTQIRRNRLARESKRVAS